MLILAFVDCINKSKKSPFFFLDKCFRNELQMETADYALCGSLVWPFNWGHRIKEYLWVPFILLAAKSGLSVSLTGGSTE